MKDRIKLVRKSLHLTQTQFAERVGLKQNFIAQVESGNRNVSNQTILNICREFRVSESWLRNGEGEMFLDAIPRDEIRRFLDSVMESEENDIRRRIILALSKLSENQLANLADIADTVAPIFAKPGSLTQEEIWEQEGEELKQAHIAKKRAEAKSSASPFTGSNTA